MIAPNIKLTDISQSVSQSVKVRHIFWFTTCTVFGIYLLTRKLNSVCGVLVMARLLMATSDGLADDDDDDELLIYSILTSEG